MNEQQPRPEPSHAAPGRTPRPDGPADDEAFVRLRAADPAAGAVPDAARLTAVLRTATGVDVGAAAPLVDATAAPTALPRTALTTAPAEPLGTSAVAAVPTPAVQAARRRWGSGSGPARWLQVAAVVAGLAVVGGGGYALGARLDRGTGSLTGGSTPLPAIALGNGADRSASGAAAPAVGAATSGSGSASSAAVPDRAMWYGSRTVFAASGLSTAGGTGSAFTFDAASVLSADTARRAAKALGVAGEPRPEWGAWTVGATDGTGAVLRLSGDGTATLSYSDPARDPWFCAGAKGAATGTVCTGDTTPTPTGDAAVAKVRDLLKTLGVDLAGATAQVRDDTTPVQDGTGATVPAPTRVTVTFSQVVEGQLTGMSWSATLVGSGVQSLWGPLAPLVGLGRYDVVSPAAAAARLNDPRFGAYGGGPVPLQGSPVATGSGVAEPDVATAPAIGSSGATTGPAPAATGAAEPGVPGSALSGAASSGTATAGPGIVVPAPAATAVPGGKPVPAPTSTAVATAPAALSAGAAIAWPVRHVTLVSARLGLALTTLPSGAAVLVPTYQLTDTDGGTWSVIAVVDSQLDLTAAG